LASGRVFARVMTDMSEMISKKQCADYQPWSLQTWPNFPE
jgi:hypothetical protein